MGNENVTGSEYLPVTRHGSVASEARESAIGFAAIDHDALLDDFARLRSVPNLPINLPDARLSRNVDQIVEAIHAALTDV